MSKEVDVLQMALVMLAKIVVGVSIVLKKEGVVVFVKNLNHN